MKRRHRDLLWSFGEAAILLVVAAVAWATRQPLVFASLGPTAYEMIEQPRMRSARPYNVVVGHLVGLGSAFFSLCVTAAWHTPKLMPAGVLSAKRLWAVVIAALLTTVINLLLRASQPAAVSTSLLVTLGSMQTKRDALAIVAGVALIALIGVPVRLARLQSLEGETPLTSASGVSSGED